MRNILVTGGLGFIGSNFIQYIFEKYPDICIYNLDAMTYAANPGNLKNIENSSRYIFINGDICNEELVRYILKTFQIQGVVHFAAESHVDNSIKTPKIFIGTNVLGTGALLSACYGVWMRAPFESNAEYVAARFHHISTDEVFGSLGVEGFFDETTPYAPNSPYAASKAASDMLVRSYNKTFGLNTVITNCSNNYGPMQHDEKLIPTIIRNALKNKPIPIYGDGKNIRDWLYVVDHCSAIDFVFHGGKSGSSYVIGGREEGDNNMLVEKVCDILDVIKPRQEGTYKQFISYVPDRPGHDRRYAINPQKMYAELKWGSEETLSSGLEKTVRWYVDKYHAPSKTGC